MLRYLLMVTVKKGRNCYKVMVLIRSTHNAIHIFEMCTTIGCEWRAQDEGGFMTILMI